jgi:hypothetical protein
MWSMLMPQIITPPPSAYADDFAIYLDRNGWRSRMAGLQARGLR